MDRRVFNHCLRWGLDLFFPRHCIHCAAPVEFGQFAYLCAHCRASVEYIRDPSCITCGYPFWGQMVSSRHCPKCRDLNPIFDGGRSLFLHRGAGATFIHSLKYQNGTFLGPDLQLMLHACEPWLLRQGALQVVPVPLHPRRERERGYNQSDWIARQLVGFLPDARFNPCLLRSRDTETQTRLGADERRENMKNAFAIHPKAVLDADQTFLIVDDVLTTGSTLNACARTLAAAGGKQLKVFTLAHG